MDSLRIFAVFYAFMKFQERSRHSYNLECLFTNDLLRLFVSSQAEKHGLTQLAVAGPLGELDLGDQYRLDPMAPLHDRRRDTTALVFSPASSQRGKSYNLRA